MEFAKKESTEFAKKFIKESDFVTKMLAVDNIQYGDARIMLSQVERCENMVSLGKLAEQWVNEAYTILRRAVSKYNNLELQEKVANFSEFGLDVIRIRNINENVKVIHDVTKIVLDYLEENAEE